MRPVRFNVAASLDGYIAVRSSERGSRGGAAECLSPVAPTRRHPRPHRCSGALDSAGKCSGAGRARRATSSGVPRDPSVRVVRHLHSRPRHMASELASFLQYLDRLRERTQRLVPPRDVEWASGPRRPSAQAGWGAR
jgi:hypothetical protein